MVSATGSEVYAATRQAFDDSGVVDGNLQHVVEPGARVPEGLSLADGARKAIEQKAVKAICLRDTLLDQINDELIRHQLALVHDLSRGQPHRRTRVDGRPQHVASGNLRYAKFLHEKGRLRPLAGAWSA